MCLIIHLLSTDMPETKLESLRGVSTYFSVFTVDIKCLFSCCDVGHRYLMCFQSPLVFKIALDDLSSVWKHRFESQTYYHLQIWGGVFYSIDETHRLNDISTFITVNTIISFNFILLLVIVGLGRCFGVPTKNIFPQICPLVAKCVIQSSFCTPLFSYSG